MALVVSSLYSQKYELTLGMDVFVSAFAFFWPWFIITHLFCLIWWIGHLWAIYSNGVNVFMAVRDQIVVFCIVLPCNSLSGIYQHFRGTFLPPSSGLRRVVDRLYRDTDMYRRPGGSLCKGVQVPSHTNLYLNACMCWNVFWLGYWIIFLNIVLILEFLWTITKALESCYWGTASLYLLQMQPWCFVAVKEEVKDQESNDDETMEEHDICQDRWMHCYYLLQK